MKTRKARPVVRFKFEDGTTLDADALEALATIERQERTLEVVKDAAHRTAQTTGAKGGRPSSEDSRDTWLRLFNEAKDRNATRDEPLSDTDIYRRIAATWKDELGRARAWPTIRDGIGRACDALAGTKTRKRRHAKKKVDV